MGYLGASSGSTNGIIRCSTNGRFQGSIRVFEWFFVRDSTSPELRPETLNPLQPSVTHLVT